MLFLFVLSLAFADTCNRRPMVLIPGIMASILEGEVNIPDNVQVPFDEDCDRSVKNKRLWIALKDINPFVNECTLGYLNAVWDDSSKMQKDIEGVTITSPQFGYTYACDSVDPNWPLSLFSKCFHDLIKKFKKLGYTDGGDMLGASFDWRYYRFDEYPHKSNWFEDTMNLIKTAYNTYDQKVVIISHSMGGLMTYKLLDYAGEEFVNTYIERWISMSTPFIGAVKTIAGAFPGNDLGLPISAEKLRPFMRSVEAGAFLFPIGGTNNFGSDPILTVKSTGKSYTADDLVELIETVDDEQFQSLYKYVISHGMEPLYKKYNYKVPFGLEMHCMISSGLETIQSVTMETEDYDGDSSLVYGEGDGTVNLQSLEFCQTFEPQTFQNLGKYTHTGILDDDASYDALYPYVCN
ncbi:Phosphatidylcholine-sterol acyltransferase [Entamoeba marina]